MFKFMFHRGLVLLVLLLVILTSCGKSPEDARKEISQMNIEYSNESFKNCIKKNDGIAVKLFLEAGMNPNEKFIYDEELTRYINPNIKFVGIGTDIKKIKIIVFQ